MSTSQQGAPTRKSCHCGAEYGQEHIVKLSPTTPRTSNPPCFLHPWQELYSNIEVYIQEHGLDQVPRQYRLLIRLIQSFINSVRELTQIAGTFGTTADLLIDFSNNLLKARNTCLQHMLNSQRCHLLAMLDDALLGICIDEWEKPASSKLRTPIPALELPWNQSIAPILRRLTEGLNLVPVWAEGDEAKEDQRVLGWMNWGKGSEDFQSSTWMKNCYFVRSRKFLQESEEIYWKRRKVNACLQGRLPDEIADEIIGDVLEFEKLPRGRLRRKYFQNEKET